MRSARLDGVDHLGEEPAVDERHDDADRRGAAAGQPRGERRGDVVELGRGVEHPVAGRGGDVGQAAQRARHRRDRDARQPRDVLDACCHCRAHRLLLTATPETLSTFAGRLSRVRTLYRNGRIYRRPRPDATAMLVDGRRDRLDRAATTRPREPRRTRVVDLAGALVTPAFVDAHVHATATGLALTGLDLRRRAHRWPRPSTASSGPRARAAAARCSAAAGTRRGWPEQRPPTAAELDRAGYGGAVYLARVDAHSAVVSSALLARRARPRASSPATGRTGS